METEEMAVEAAGGLDQKYWFRVGSIAAIVLGIGSRLSKLGFRFVKEKRPSIW